jgi:hypothetical protein
MRRARAIDRVQRTYRYIIKLQSYVAIYTRYIKAIEYVTAVYTDTII